MSMYIKGRVLTDGESQFFYLCDPLELPNTLKALEHISDPSAKTQIDKLPTLKQIAQNHGFIMECKNGN